MDRVFGDTCTLNLVHAGTSRGTHAIASRPSLPRGRRRGVPGDTKAGRSLALARRPSRKLVAMEAQAKAPATASGKDPRRPGGGSPPGAAEEASKRVEGGGDSASRSTAKREAEQAAAAAAAAVEGGASKPLPHEQVPQPRDVYNEQLERL